MNAAAPLRSVGVFGGGVVAASAALAFARALPHAQVILVVIPVAPGALADRLPVLWPAAQPVLERLGLPEPALHAAGAAVPLLARRFRDWGRGRDAWLCPEGEPVTVPGLGLLHHRWLLADACDPFHALFPAAALAQAGRFASEALLPPPMDRADHALAIAPDRFGALLADRCRRARVRIDRGTIAGVEHRPDGGVRTVQLADRTRLEADLFIDATGPEAHLSGDNGIDDWSMALPCDRLLLHPVPAQASLLEDYAASELGWSARWPRPGGEVQALAFAAAITPEKRALRAFSHDAVPVTIRPGRRRCGWSGNLLRLGEAAAQPGPLALAGYSLAMAQLTLALELLPGRDMEPLLVAEYNRRAALRADRLRDLLAAHYLLGTRRHGPFWQAMAGRPLPPGLADTLAQFGRAGLLPHHDEESVGADCWRALLIGLGVRPRRADPIARAADPATLRAALDEARRTLAGAAASVPRYPAPAGVPA